MMRWKGYQQGAKADLQEERDRHVDKTVEEGRCSETEESELEGKGFCDRHALLPLLISKLSLI